MAQSYVAANPFDAECKKVIRFLQKKLNGRMKRSELLKKTKLKSSQLDDIVNALIDRQEIKPIPYSTRGKSGTIYQLTSFSFEGEISSTDKGPV